MRTVFTVHDQFCGAGGSSLGIRNLSAKYGGGLEVALAMNHWRLAIETHSANFPETDHDCADMSAVDPRRYPSADMLITSPECTNHSLAKGVKRRYQQTQTLFGKLEIDPSAERSRATMWDVPRFAEVHNYNLIIVENVVDARMWIMWDAWLHAMHNLGYLHRCVYLNSMHALPTPQSRDRMYVVFWKKGNPAPDLDITPAAFCPDCGKQVNAIQSWKNPKKKFGKYRQQYVYRCPCCGGIVEPYYYSAFNCIDWSIPSQKIGERKKPLSPNTIRRIEYGIDKYGNQPLVLHGDHASVLDRSHPLDCPMFTQATRQVAGLICPGFLSKQYGGGFDPKHSPVGLDDPAGTITTTDHHALVQFPHIVTTRYTSGIECRVKSSCQPLPTQPGDASHYVLGIPFVVENFGTSKSKPITDPVGCQTTSPNYGLVSNEAVNAFLTYYYGRTTTSGMNAPVGTVTTKERAAVVMNPAENIDINECTYRMLVDREIQRAMAFNDDYIILGNSKDKVRQLGNAVTPPAMELIAERCIQSLI